MSGEGVVRSPGHDLAGEQILVADARVCGRSAVGDAEASGHGRLTRGAWVVTCMLAATAPAAATTVPAGTPVGVAALAVALALVAVLPAPLPPDPLPHPPATSPAPISAAATRARANCLTFDTVAAGTAGAPSRSEGV